VSFLDGLCRKTLGYGYSPIGHLNATLAIAADVLSGELA